MSSEFIPIVEKVINAYGDVSKVQKRFGYTEPMGVYNWRNRGLPQKHLAQIHIDTGIPLKELMESTSNQAA